MLLTVVVGFVLHLKNVISTWINPNHFADGASVQRNYVHSVLIVGIIDAQNECDTAFVVYRIVTGLFPSCL